MLRCSHIRKLYATVNIHNVATIHNCCTTINNQCNRSRTTLTSHQHHYNYSYTKKLYSHNHTCNRYVSNSTTTTSNNNKKYTSTINLPVTTFNIHSKIQQRQQLVHDKITKQLYEWQRNNRQHLQQFILHDGRM